MEYRELGSTGLKPSVIGLGTWVMGGWMWGGAEDRESLATIRRAIDLGVNLIDTAPIYGHGRSEELVGRAVADSDRREYLILATKVGLEWNPEKTRVWRNASRTRISQEIEDSLRRLRTDYIDIYQMHWPDRNTPFEETMEALLDLQRQGKIRFIGLSNFDEAQIERCLAVGPVHVLQPPYNLFERGIEEAMLPYCISKRIGTLIYGPLCRGLLSGKYRGHETFGNGDVREMDPKFKGEAFHRYVACVERLRTVATPYGKTVGQMAIRWCLDQPGVTVALCGARRPEQIEDNAGGAGWSLSPTEEEAMNRVLTDMIGTPVGPEFMGPP
ncbi:MAG: aldo/keto reductase [Nitrospiraceae bacterium]